MSEIVHPAQQLRQAEIEYQIASRRSSDLDQQRPAWRMLSPRRFATLCGVESLLKHASTIYGAAGADPQSPLITAIRALQDKTGRRLRSILAAYSVLAAAVLMLSAIIGWLFCLSSTNSPAIITNPKTGAAVDMTISVSGSPPRGSLPPGTNLYLLVKPQGFNYWLQPLPEVTRTGWRVEKAGIGNKEEDRGRHFLICAVMTRQVLPMDWNAPDLPVGDSHCIDVTRK